MFELIALSVGIALALVSRNVPRPLRAVLLVGGAAIGAIIISAAANELARGAGFAVFDFFQILVAALATVILAEGRARRRVRP